MTAPMVDAPVASRSDVTSRTGGEVLGVAAQLCGHTMAICRALDRGAGELTVALAEAAEHADAILELAIGLAQAGAGAVPSAGMGEWWP